MKNPLQFIIKKHDKGYSWSLCWGDTVLAKSPSENEEPKHVGLQIAVVKQSGSAEIIPPEGEDLQLQ